MPAESLKPSDTQQLWLDKRARRSQPACPMCHGCWDKEARYGFQTEEQLERPRALCFNCFRMELDRRRAVTAQLARGWNAFQVRLPLTETIEDTARRRRFAQIAARKALDA